MGGVQHVALLITRKRLLAWKQNVTSHEMSKFCFLKINSIKRMKLYFLNFELFIIFGVDNNRAVAEMSTEKRLSSRKGKSKTADSRKQLSSVRVVQRNLVYIVGLPLSLADEDVCTSRN